MKNSLSSIAKLSVVAGIYAVLTIALAPISFGMLQLRLSELLMIFVVFNKKYTISLTLGCLVANIVYGDPLDICFGTLGTLIACVAITLIKNRYISLIFTPLSNGLFLALEAYLIQGTWGIAGLTFLYIFISEFIVVYVFGLILYKAINKSESFKKLIENV